MNRAFSLVELSIVLVILGLLTGGILAGQSLIRASELRSISTDFGRYQAAMYSFRDKYFALPGDMTNATKFWGKDTAQCNADPAAAGTPGTCNGNGDGIFTTIAAANTTGEFFQFWKQLALAGLVEGSYTGISGAAATGRDVTIGTNVPRSRIGNAGFSIYSAIVPAGHADRWDSADGNVLNFGSRNPGGYETDQPALKAEEAWNVDTKMDDGRPSQGNLLSYKDGLNPSCATPQTDSGAAFNLSNPAVTCALQLLTSR